MLGHQRQHLIPSRPSRLNLSLCCFARIPDLRIGFESICFQRARAGWNTHKSCRVSFGPTLVTIWPIFTTTMSKPVDGFVVKTEPPRVTANKTIDNNNNYHHHNISNSGSSSTAIVDVRKEQQKQKQSATDALADLELLAPIQATMLEFSPGADVLLRTDSGILLGTVKNVYYNIMKRKTYYFYVKLFGLPHAKVCKGRHLTLQAGSPIWWKDPDTGKYVAAVLQRGVWDPKRGSNIYSLQLQDRTVHKDVTPESFVYRHEGSLPPDAYDSTANENDGNNNNSENGDGGRDDESLIFDDSDDENNGCRIVVPKHINTNRLNLCKVEKQEPQQEGRMPSMPPFKSEDINTQGYSLPSRSVYSHMPPGSAPTATTHPSDLPTVPFTTTQPSYSSLATTTTAPPQSYPAIPPKPSSVAQDPPTRQQSVIPTPGGNQSSGLSEYVGQTHQQQQQQQQSSLLKRPFSLIEEQLSSAKQEQQRKAKKQQPQEQPQHSPGKHKTSSRHAITMPPWKGPKVGADIVKIVHVPVWADFDRIHEDLVGPGGSAHKKFMSHFKCWMSLGGASMQKNSHTPELQVTIQCHPWQDWRSIVECIEDTVLDSVDANDHVRMMYCLAMDNDFHPKQGHVVYQRLPPTDEAQWYQTLGVPESFPEYLTHSYGGGAGWNQEMVKRANRRQAKRCKIRFIRSQHPFLFVFGPQADMVATHVDVIVKELQSHFPEFK